MNLAPSTNYKANILVVDDTPANVRVLVKILQSNGSKVRPVTDEQVFLRCHLAAQFGIKAGFGVPIIFNEQVLAILVFFSKQAMEIEQRFLELVKLILA